jgi:heavy metal translocating P-type ATPase
MIISLGVLLTAYTGVKLFDNYRHIKATSKHKSVKVAPKKSLKFSQSQTIIDAPEKMYDRYFKVSMASMGLFVLAPLSPWLYLLSIASVIYTCVPILKLGEKQLFKRRTIGHDVLFSSYVLLSFATHQEALLSISIFFYHAGLKLFAKNQAESKPLITNIFKQQPDKVWILKEGVEIEIPLSEVKSNDIVSVKTGEVVAIDGRIIKGMATIDQQALTGESQPVEKGVGDQVFASTLIVTGQIQVQVEKAGNETTIHHIGQILNNTAAYTTFIQLKGERWSNLIAIPIFSLTVFAVPTLGLLGATTVAHSGFGNRIRVLAPLGTLNYLHLAFSNGLLIKDGRAMEELKKIDTVVFDKTGTLTKEQPEVGQILVFNDDYETNDILTYAAAAECRLAHPLAHAIVNKAEESNIVLPHIEDSKYQIGYGITVNMTDKMIRVGSVRFMETEDIPLSKEVETAMQQARANGHSLVMVAINHQIAGAIEIQSAVRAEVKNIISGLRERGIKHISIVSGDHQHTTQILAESLGMDSYFYEVLPQQKAEIVEQLQQEGKKVCFVGDGINDAIAMKMANVSVSLRGATSIATDTAQVVLMDGSLSRLCELFDIARHLNSNLLRSLAIIVIPSIINLTGAFLLGFRMVASTIITNTGFTIALANAMHPWLLRYQSESRDAKHRLSTENDREKD